MHIIPAIGGLKLKPLKTTHVQTMLNSLPAKGLKPSMVAAIRRTIVRALNIAPKWGEIKHNVAVDTEVPQVIQRKPPSLTEPQLDRLLDVISGDTLETLIASYSAPARISECLGLLWANIDREEHLQYITGAIKRRKLDTPRDGKNYTTVRDSYTKIKYPLPTSGVHNGCEIERRFSLANGFQRLCIVSSPCGVKNNAQSRWNVPCCRAS